MKKILLVFAATLTSYLARAQQMPDPDTTAKHFMTVASIGNLQEASAGQLAVQKGLLPDVKAFGKMMVMDHQQAQTKLLQLAKRKGYQIPAEATGGIVPDLKLKNATDSFDRLYVHAMIASHQNTVEQFENYATTGKDPDVKAFAQQTLPTLKAHLAEIKAIDEKIKYQAAK